jgi:riboflavin synthase
MFTGIVEDLGVVTHTRITKGVQRITVRSSVAADCARLGNSVALNGVCLTIVATEKDCITVEAVPETLRLTNLGDLAVQSKINVERPLAMGDTLGGHFVQGHVDTTVSLIDRTPDGGSEMLRFTKPEAFAKHVVAKGFVALDGVSLTVVNPATDSFSIALIPHTRQSVTLGSALAGYRANFEADILSKYGRSPDPSATLAPSIDLLRGAGFPLDETR